MSAESACWCGSGDAAAVCCQPLLAGERHAVTAQALMRSRYSAYAIMNEAYLLATWHPDTRPEQLKLTATQKWLGLKIYAVLEGDVDDTAGIVEFAARFKIGGRGHRLRERSRFVKMQDRWYYLDGEAV